MQDTKDLVKKEVAKTDDSWENDQKERGYYYDDAHGYEEFDPESEDDENDDNRESAETEV